MTNTPALQLTQVSKTFISKERAVQALSPIDLTVQCGEFVCFLGASGCGKSTLLSIIAGLEPASGGTIVAEGVEVRGTGIDRVMMFQDAALFPWLTVQGNVEFALKQQGIPRRERAELARTWIERVRLGGFENSPVHQLSGGMRQRVVIAMALLARPKLLIADEPTTALDVSVEAQVMDQICTLRDQIGCSVLLITHSLGLVGRYCESVTVIYAGEMVEEGPVASVMAHPTHPYTGRLLDCDVEIDQPLATTPEAERFAIIAGQLPDLHALPTGCIFQPRCSAADARCSAQPAMRPVVGTGGHLARCWVAP